MSDFLIILGALFRNKFRIDESKSKKSVIAFGVFLGVAYVICVSAFILILVVLKDILSVLASSYAPVFYFFVLITCALIVLIFGIIFLISTLYLSKDTDFFSVLPVKSHVVFAAKIAFVYIMETALVAALALPLLIAYGIIIRAWALYYVITFLLIFIVPALPLVLAAILGIPVMFIASKLKNRGVVALLFYMVLFGALFGVYIYFIWAMGNISEEAIYSLFNGISAVLNAFYPYKALAYAACGFSSFGLSIGISTVVNLLIFIGSSVVLAVILLFAAKFMYSQSVKANNQTDNSKAKKSEFKTATSFRALVKREYLSSMRTTQTAFQCYFVMLLPIIVSIIFGIMITRTSAMFANFAEEGVDIGMSVQSVRLMSFCTLAAIFATMGNAASTTFSREGGAIASLKILPIGIKSILKAKIMSWLFLAVPTAVIAVVTVNAFSFEWQSFLLSVFLLVPLAAMFVIFGALWDLSAPKLKWTDPMQAIKHNGHVTIAQLISLGGGLIVLFLVNILSSNGVGMNITVPLCWALLYFELACFAVINIVLYRKCEEYYNRIEI